MQGVYWGAEILRSERAEDQSEDVDRLKKNDKADSFTISFSVSFLSLLHQTCDKILSNSEIFTEMSVFY